MAPTDKATNLPYDGPPSEFQRSTSPASPAEPDQRRSLDSSLLNFPSLMSEPELSPLRRLRNQLGGHGSPSTAPQTSASEENSPKYGRLRMDKAHSKRHLGHSRRGSNSELGSLPSTRATNGDVSPRNRRFIFPRSRSPSRSRSRAVSPLRIIQSISAGLHQQRHQNQQEQEERFVPINPFNSHISFNFKNWSSFGIKSKKTEADIEMAEGSVSASNTSDSTVGAGNCDEILMISSIRDCGRHANVFLLDVFPRLIYLSLLLRLPAMYFSRVARVFREAEVSRPDIERMVEVGQYCVLPSAFDNQDVYVFGPSVPPLQGETPDIGGDKKRDGRGRRDGARHHGATGSIGVAAPTSGQGAPAEPECNVTPAMRRFKLSWEMFIDSLLREWKTLNVVSALLASAILTIFQIPDAAADPVTRSTAVVSLICALMSLTYGCMYIVRFGAMRSLLRASRWAEEVRRTNTMILWNVWVLLAMPAVWLAWSMLIFIASILTFVWRTGSASDPSPRPPPSELAVLGPRIVITFVVFLGFLYLYLIIRTLKSYGIHAGRSESILTSPQARLGVLGDVHHHSRPRVQAMTPSERPASILAVSQTRSNEVLEVAFERRGRERTRSESARHGRRREERLTERMDRSVSRRDGM